MNLRVKKEKKYTTVDNGFINDPRLSASSIGVLLYLMSKPDDWKAHKREIVRRFDKASINTTKNLIDNVFKELRKAGYVRMIPIPSEGGKFKGTEYEIREISDIPYNPTSENIPTSEDNRPSKIHPHLLKPDLKPSTEEEETKTKKNIKKDFYSEKYTEWKKIFGALRSKKGEAEKRFNQIPQKEIDNLIEKTKQYKSYMTIATWRDKKTASAFLNDGFWDQDWDVQKNQALKKVKKEEPRQSHILPRSEKKNKVLPKAS